MKVVDLSCSYPYSFYHADDAAAGEYPQSVFIATSSGVKIKNEIAKCKSELEQAIKSQEFEKAAELRDRIRELEKNFSSEGKE